MRQVNRDELLWNVINGLRKASAMHIRGLTSSQHEVQSRARALIADGIVKELGRFEILSDSEVGHPAGDALYSGAARRYLDMRDGSGVAPVDVPRTE